MEDFPFEKNPDTRPASTEKARENGESPYPPSPGIAQKTFRLKKPGYSTEKVREWKKALPILFSRPIDHTEDFPFRKTRYPAGVHGKGKRKQGRPCLSLVHFVSGIPSYVPTPTALRPNPTLCYPLPLPLLCSPALSSAPRQWFKPSTVLQP
jgi:hypothetical protein